MSMTFMVPGFPDANLNLSNRNARLILEAVGLPTDEYSLEIPAGAIPSLRRTVMRVMNGPDAGLPVVQASSERHVRVTREQGLPTIRTGALVIDPGLDADGMRFRLMRLLDLCNIANGAGVGILVG